MKMKVQHVMDATLVVTSIINARRPMPHKAKFRLARMHAKLNAEFELASAQRNSMIEVYEVYEPLSEDDGMSCQNIHGSRRFIVPPDKTEEFAKAWKEVGDSEVEVDIEPIPIRFFDMGDMVDGPINADEIIVLGDLLSGD